ncbi:serine/threonine-protein kinase [Mycolicibacterium sphagni]|uniref:serine/threonine-protein kinase n=1 Tax=Mycolicibacterium sphagni TaxID=1786 RepID=UPI0021F29A10|nr:serine/threonine-protein kinase [Mycolicibacterium sphagni]MCV7176171.1 serine/threonine protein kinase [Mycolicibacterium sphagni]
MGIRVGDAFGNYTIKRVLGKGGMGEVFEAYDTTKHRVVALKILSDQFAQDQRFRERFQRESRAAAVLQEPHVIPIHDWGEIDGRLYIDMRLVAGESLHEVLRNGPLAPERAVTIAGHVAAALDAAHAAGLIHRDVKPQNIMLTADDFAYLVDFGIAEARGDSHLTIAGTQVGSMAYMAPERFGEDGATPAVDVYALACVLCEMLTGASPFPADSLEQVIGAHLSAPPPRPSVISPRVPAALDDVVARGMAKDPDDRYGSAGAVARAAARALAPANPNAVPPPIPPAYTFNSAPTYYPGAYYPGPPSGPFPSAAGYAGPVTGSTPVVDPGPGTTRNKWLIPAALAVVAVLLLAGIGLTVGLLLGRQGDTNAAGSVAPYTPSGGAPQAQVPSSAPGFPAPVPAGPPPLVRGPDNSARHEQCDDGWSISNASGWGTRSGRGSPQTSCFFARSVLLSYWNQYGNASRDARTVSAPGAVDCRSVGAGACDGANFVMQCVADGADNWITCTGGNNARVYLY